MNADSSWCHKSCANFRARVVPFFKDVRDYFKAWFDYFFLHNKTEEGIIDVLEKFFEICEARDLKISAIKSVLCTLAVRWCGRIIDRDGVRCDPKATRWFNGSSCPNQRLRAMPVCPLLAMDVSLYSRLLRKNAAVSGSTQEGIQNI